MKSIISFSVFLTVCITQATFSHPAIGDIISYSGAIEIVDDTLVPDIITEGIWENDDSVRVFSERQSYMLPTSVEVDVTSPGTYGRSAGFVPSGQSIGLNTEINSYFLHFDPVGTPGNMTRTGVITFDSDVLGIIVGVVDGINAASPDNTLGLSNAILGIPRITYDVAITDLYVGGGDQITLSSDRRSLTILLISGPGSDNIRIITAIPEPSSFLLTLAACFSLLRARPRKGFSA